MQTHKGKETALRKIRRESVCGILPSIINRQHRSLMRTDGGWPALYPNCIWTGQPVHHCPSLPCPSIVSPFPRALAIVGVLKITKEGVTPCLLFCTDIIFTIGICGRPVAGSDLKHFIVLFVLRRHHRILRIIRLSGRQQRLQGQQHRTQGHRSSPVLFEDVKANGTGNRRDVGVPDLCNESHLGRIERIRLRHLNLQLEFTTRVRGIWWTRNLSFQLSPVVFYQLNLNATFYDLWEGERR